LVCEGFEAFLSEAHCEVFYFLDPLNFFLSGAELSGINGVDEGSIELDVGWVVIRI